MHLSQRPIFYCWHPEGLAISAQIRRIGESVAPLIRNRKRWSSTIRVDHFERDPIAYALETDWPVGAGGFEPLHRCEIRQDSQPGAAGFEPLHFRIGIREDSQPGAAG